jgi:hypothetical protein
VVSDLPELMLRPALKTQLDLRDGRNAVRAKWVLLQQPLIFKDPERWQPSVAIVVSLIRGLLVRSPAGGMKLANKIQVK